MAIMSITVTLEEAKVIEAVRAVVKNIGYGEVNVTVAAGNIQLISKTIIEKVGTGNQVLKDFEKSDKK